VEFVEAGPVETFQNESAHISFLEDAVREKQRELDLERKKLQKCQLKLEKVREATNIFMRTTQECQAGFLERISGNVNRTLYPLIAHLRSTGLTEAQRHLVNVLEFNIKHLASGLDVSLVRTQKLLSARELEICLMIREGHSCREIAASLGISPETIMAHRKNIRKKLGLTNRKQNLESFIRESL